MRRLFLFGAGSSAGTFDWNHHPVPSAAAFGKALRHIDRHWPATFGALAKVVGEHLRRSLDDFSLEELWTCVDWYAKLKPALPPPAWTTDEASRFGPEIKKLLLVVYGSRCDKAAARLPPDASYTLGRLFAEEIHPGDVIASFNYDTIAERVAANTFSRTLRAVGRSSSGAAITLAKPHGSASWSMNPFTRTLRSCDTQGAPLLDSLSAADVDRGFEPLLLGAVPIKSELILEVQDKLGPHGNSWKQIYDTVLSQWGAVVAALASVDCVIIVGYSFPREDTYGRFMIREALRSRSAPPLVEFFELKDRACEREKEILDAFDHRVRELTYRGPVTPAACVAA